MFEIPTPEFPEIPLSPIPENTDEYVRGYEALLGQVPAPALAGVEEVFNGLASDLDPADVLSQQKKAVASGDSKKILAALKATISKRSEVEAFNQSGIAEELLYEAVEQDLNKAFETILANHEPARQKFNEVGARFTELWYEHFWDCTFEYRIISNDSELSKHLPELYQCAYTIWAAAPYIQYLKKYGVLKGLGDMPNLLTENDAHPATDTRYQGKVRYQTDFIGKSPEERAAASQYRTIALVADLLFRVPKPGQQIAIKWKSLEELKQEAEDMKQMQARIGGFIGNEARVSLYWSQAQK